MTGTRNVWLLLLCLVSAWPAVAEIRIGYVNLARVVEEAPQSKEALRKLDVEFSTRNQQALALQKKLGMAEDELRTGATTMKDGDRRQRELLALRHEVKRTLQELRDDYNQRRNAELANLQQLIQRMVADFARQENYDLILQEGVAYTNPAVDLTERILKRLGKP